MSNRPDPDIDKWFGPDIARWAAQDKIVVELAEIPSCSFDDTPAAYDGATKMGPWAYMCQRHFENHGVGVGMGRGQRLVKAEEKGTEAEA